MKSLVTCLLALAVLSGCGTAPVAPAVRDAGPLEAKGKGRLVLKAGSVGIGPGLPGVRPEILGATFEVEKFLFNQRPGSAHVAIHVGGKVVAGGMVYPAADGKLYLGEYNGGKEGDYVVLGTYEAEEPGRLPFGTKLKAKLDLELDYYYRHEGGIMGQTTFYLIAKEAPKAVRKAVPFVKMAPARS